MDSQPSRKKIILVTIIMAALVVGLIILFAVLATRKKSEPAELPNTSTEIAGEYILEEEKANPTSASTESSSNIVTTTIAAATTETSTTLPKTGPTSLIGLSLVAGFAAYLGTARLIKHEA